MADTVVDAQVPEPFRKLRWASGSPPAVLLRGIVPLSIGIHNEFAALLADPEGDRSALGEALRWHVNTVAYNKAILHLHAVRFDAHGAPGAAITKVERALKGRSRGSPSAVTSGQSLRSKRKCG